MHRYVIADVFTDVPLQGNRLAVFTDASGLSDELMQRTARELNLSETVFVLPAGRGRRCARAHLHARRRAAVRGASRARHGVRPRRAARGDDRPVADRPRDDPGRADPRGAIGSCSARWSSGSPSPSSSIAPTRCLRALGCRALRAADRALPQRTTSSCMSRSTARRRSRPSSPDLARCRHSGRSASAVSPAAARTSRRGCSARASASPRIRRPARRRARSRCTSPATAGASSARRSRSARATRSDALR